MPSPLVSFDQTFQAEDALFSGPEIFTGRDAQGTGYVDYQNPSGDFIEWAINVPASGSYELSWRYQNGGGNRPLELQVNSSVIDSNLDFPNTGGWTANNWEFATQVVQLNAGTNTIGLTATGQSGANFDYMNVRANSVNDPGPIDPGPIDPGPIDPVPDVSISNASAIEGTDDYLIFDIGLTAPSSEAITLDLVALDNTARGGLSADFGIDPSGDPIDYEDQAFEISANNGVTWQAAANGTEVTFAPGDTTLKVRLAVNDDTATEGSTTESMQLAVASVLAGTVGDATDRGNGLISDNETSVSFDQIFQAEDAILSGPEVFAGRDAQGAGYVDYQNPSGDLIEWTINVPVSGLYELSWRYQNGGGNRPLAFQVNSSVVDSNLDFPNTGGWTANDWEFTTQVVQLNAGTNTISLTATGQSGANFDYMHVRADSVNDPGPIDPGPIDPGPIDPGPDVSISNASATEGTNDYLVFDIGLTAPSSESITLDLVALDNTARGGLSADFNIDPSGDPIDYEDQAFEISANNGVTWQTATNGTEVTFAPGDTTLKVRLAVNDDTATEGSTAERMQLAVAGVLSGTVGDATDSGNGLITDNETSVSGTPPISLLPATDVRVEGDITFAFDGQDGGLSDGDTDTIGFTMVDPASSPGNPGPVGGVVGYWPEKLDVNNGVLEITATSGIQYTSNNNQDNMLGIGLNLPSQDLKLETTLVDLPTAGGGFSQAGLWFGQATSGGDGSSEDNYIKLVAISPNAGDYQVQALMEQSGVNVQSKTFDIPDNPASLDLQLFLDPGARSVTAFYSVSGGGAQPLTTFNDVPDEWFSFDQAGIDPTIATRSFGGIFATSRNAGSEQVFSFDDFSVTAESPSVPPSGPSPTSDISFDRWTLPVDKPTAMDVGPDGRLYVATIFGDIYAFDLEPETNTFSQELITTIPDQEGGGRLTLGIAVDPDSTANNVELWVGHSDGSVNNGAVNSAKVSKLSGPGFTQKEDVVTGLPRAIANHALNNIDFGPDGNLYLWFGGNTGAGAANNLPSEFRDRPEQVFSAAVLEVDINSWNANPSNFHRDASSPIGEFIDEFYARKASELGREYTEVTVFASGLRNTYDGVFHSNGQIYSTDNGLGVIGTVPPVPRLGDPTDRNITTLFGENPIDNPGTQPDPLNRIVEGGYYGHPNPYRDEVVFKDGSFQGFDNTDGDPTNDIPAGHPAYIPPFLNLGFNKSANGIIEYTADNFFGALQGDLLITNFSQGDSVSRVQLSPNGLSTVNYDDSFQTGFIDPLPISMGLNGSDLEGIFFVGELNGDGITVMESLGVWRQDLPDLPNASGVLDAGSAVLGDQLYMVGGKTSNGPISDVYVYSPGNPINQNDDVWTPLASDLPGPAVENPAVVAFDDQLYVFGGSTGPFAGAQDSVSMYDPTSGLWTSLPDMPTARGGAQAAVLNNKIYVIGGLAADGASLDTVEAFDPITGTWLTGPLVDPAELQTRRDNPGVAVADGKLHVFGGRTRDANGTTVNGGLNTMEIYDPILDQWTFGESMPTGRRTMAVGTVDGRIQVIAGEGTPSLNIHEEYNPATGSWRTLPSIATPRHGAAFGTINDVVYVAGGGPTPGSSFTDVTEAFTF